ncbi:sucrose transporter4 [Zea mays]|uniref:Sucrose transporter4 n=1 Tax=Zea mays TaxID=4577 RepID=A0A1D6MV10_MAIZE|nr:sucrose transporter4 [Zea mays]
MPPRTAPAATSTPPRKVPLRKLLRAASVACGVQFGWALQLSLLTPYVQELGIPHAFASLVWLCGPLSGLLVQPLVGHLSDRIGPAASPLGRRRPFIAAGAACIAAAVLTVGFSADLGRLFGDDVTPGSTRLGAICVYLVGFWLLDVGNNGTQGPCRAFLADLTESCGISCANLKSAFLLDIIVLVITTYTTVTSVQEPQTFGSDEAQNPGAEQEAFLWELFGSLRYFTLPIWMITYSIPYAMAASRVENLGLGQGLAMGILNLAIVIPQVIVSLGSGPWDQLFGGGNAPAFAVAAGASFIGGLVAILGLPRARIASSSSRRRGGTHR